MKTALTTNVSVSDVIVYNSVVENVIKSGLSSMSGSSAVSSTNAGSGTNSSAGSSSSTTTLTAATSTLTAADKTNIQNLYESYVDSIGQMSMKAISKGQVITSSSNSIAILIIPLPSLSSIE